MANLGRRKVLKVMTAAGASAVIPLGLNANSDKLYANKSNLSVYVDVKQYSNEANASSEIVNLTDKPLILNGSQPVSYKNTDGDITTVHLNTPNEIYTLKPGERLPIYAKAVMTNSPDMLKLQTGWNKSAIAIV